MSDDDLITSAVSRLFKLGGLAGRVGVSVTGSLVKGLFQSLEGKEENRAANMVGNALRVAETLGNLKGVPMKLGQMLSLYEGLLPPEVITILSTLQKAAPALSFETIRQQIESELPDGGEIFASIEPEAYAAASIGQVHRGVMKNGQSVAIKVQYPGIDQVIAADMKNLKGVLRLLFSILLSMDLDPIWDELNERLLEELDYEKEAEHLRVMSGFYHDHPTIHIPEVIDEASGRHILTMTLLEGLSPAQACSAEFDQKMRDRWGQTIFDFVLAGIFRHHFLHADPNLANFAFREDGGIVVYDFGCVKRVPTDLSQGYAALVRAVLEDRVCDIPGILHSIGAHRVNGEPVPMKMVEDYATVLKIPFRREPRYTFGQEKDIYEEVIKLSGHYLLDSMDLEFPRDIVFIDRTIAGHFGNLNRLKAGGPWREMLERYV